MKKLIIVLTVAILSGCTTYKKFVEVKDVKHIPNGVTKLFAETDLKCMEQLFVDANIKYEDISNGISTQIFQIDEGTRAYYDVFEKNNIVEIHCYWGITEMVNSQVAAWAGTGQAVALSSMEMKRLVYKKSETRPKIVMDYMVTLLENKNIKYSWM